MFFLKIFEAIKIQPINKKYSQIYLEIIIPNLQISGWCDCGTIYAQAWKYKDCKLLGCGYEIYLLFLDPYLTPALTDVFLRVMHCWCILLFSGF